MQVLSRLNQNASKSDIRIPSQKEDYCIVKYQLFIIYIAELVSNGNANKNTCIQIGLDELTMKGTFSNWLVFVYVHFIPFSIALFTRCNFIVKIYLRFDCVSL